MSYYYEVLKANTNNKYSKGIGFNAGLYKPSYVYEMRCSNATIVKEIKKIDNGYDYKYYFDEKNRIILSEKYLSNKLRYINYYFYTDNYLEFIHYEVDSGIYYLSKSFYDENDKICRHIQIKICVFKKNIKHVIITPSFHMINLAITLYQRTFFIKRKKWLSRFLLIISRIFDSYTFQ